MKNSITLLTDELAFPAVDQALSDGLLAIGGDLSVERLLLAYSKGIFPWFNEGAPIMWWSPDPRMVLFPNEIKISKSMRKVLRDEKFKLTKNRCFNKVISMCSCVKRGGQEGTWITKQMQLAYNRLHKEGFAHSYEVWVEEELVGGLYGIDLGHVFCGESMFSLVSNASKFAFIKLAKELELKNYKLIDCQMYTAHLESLGAREIDRNQFIELISKSNLEEYQFS